MKNKKLNLAAMAQKSATLSTKEQEAVKGGYKFFKRAHNPTQTRIVGLEIRFTGTPDENRM